MIARSYAAKCGMETVVLRPPWVVSPEQMEELRRDGGRAPTRFSLCNYVDARDLAEAYRLAVERPIDGHTVLFTTANDSSTNEPLCSLFPRLLPDIGDMAQELTDGRPSVTNNRAKQLLGWRPKYRWRQTSGSRPV